MTKDKNVVITHGIYTEDVHVCNSSGQLNYSYLMDEFHAGLLSISDDWNEIIAAEESVQEFRLYLHGDRKKFDDKMKFHKIP